MSTNTTIAILGAAAGAGLVVLTAAASFRLGQAATGGAPAQEAALARATTVMDRAVRDYAAADWAVHGLGPHAHRELLADLDLDGHGARIMTALRQEVGPLERMDETVCYKVIETAVTGQPSARRATCFAELTGRNGPLRLEATLLEEGAGTDEAVWQLVAFHAAWDRPA